MRIKKEERVRYEVNPVPVHPFLKSPSTRLGLPSSFAHQDPKSPQQGGCPLVLVSRRMLVSIAPSSRP